MEKENLDGAYNTYIYISCLESSTKSANPTSNLFDIFLNLPGNYCTGGW